MSNADQLVRAALAATTLDDAIRLQNQLAAAIGAEYMRPLADRWNNHGLMGQAGTFDHKLVEQVTNMQDAVLERLALVKFGAEPIPYRTPREAAADLLREYSAKEQRDLASVRFVKSDGDPLRSKRLTAIFRDRGCGMRAEQLPRTIFHLGGTLKEDRLWQQGAFGLGGALTYRNTRAVVLVSRRDPALLRPGQPDTITVAVVLWLSNVKGAGAYYLTTTPWNDAGDVADPWSCSANEVPEFEAGTHLALISYGVEGVHRKYLGDERSFDTIANTRLFKPVMPIRFRNEIIDKVTTLFGLHKKLVEDRDQPIPNEGLSVPFSYEGTTYELPISYYLFSKPGDPGNRRNFVAHDHVVAFTSNGQIQHHWTRPDFRARTRLNKLADRILVVVETDALPIELRTSFFTPDRTSLVRTDVAVRLEETIAAALNDWDSLQEENSKLIRDALRGGNEQTLDAALKISRLLDFKGFQLGKGDGSSGGAGGAGSGGGGGRPKEIDTKLDPTYIDGPVYRAVQIGKTSFMTIYIDAVDEFWERGRGQLRVECDHADIGLDEITYSMGRKGRVKLSVAVPETAQPGTEELRVTLEGWHRAAGGLGPTLTHTCKLEFATEVPGRGTGSGKPGGGDKGDKGAGGGNHVALLWTNPDKQDWRRTTVGEVQDLPATDVAAISAAYAELAKLGDQLIPVILLNEEYPPWKTYLSSRSRSLVDLSRPKETYAVGVGVELVIIQKELERRQSEGLRAIDEDFVRLAQSAAARAVLAVMPAADEIAKQAGLDDD